MSTVEGVSDRLMEFALFALDHAADCVIPRGGPLVPFSVVEIDGERTLSRLPGDIPQGIEAARETVRQSAGATLGAVAWDGYLTRDGDRTDAVFVEASEARGERSVILAQRYRSAGRVLRKRMEAVGNAAVVDYGDPLF